VSASESVSLSLSLSLSLSESDEPPLSSSPHPALSATTPHNTIAIAETKKTLIATSLKPAVKREN
jgi:hypothetical protein